MNTPRLYVYKLTADSGAAPHVEGDLLSLAICKPIIRRHAEVGDILFGFAGRSLHPDQRLVYIAHVTAVVPGQEYYAEPIDRHRADCIYLFHNGRYVVRNDARYHGTLGHLRHDLGPPPDYPRARVLVSEDFRYFGGDCELSLWDYPAVTAMLDRLGVGHRVYHPPQLRADLEALTDQVWRKFPARVCGVPSEPNHPSPQSIAWLGSLAREFAWAGFQPGRWHHSPPDPQTGVRSFPFYAYSPVVLRFIERLYADGWVYSFDWVDWWPSKGENARHRIEIANLNTLRKLLTWAVRADRFSEGHLASWFEDGTLLRICQRARTLAVTHGVEPV